MHVIRLTLVLTSDPVLLNVRLVSMTPEPALLDYRSRSCPGAGVTVLTLAPSGRAALGLFTIRSSVPFSACFNLGSGISECEAGFDDSAAGSFGTLIRSYPGAGVTMLTLSPSSMAALGLFIIRSSVETPSVNSTVASRILGYFDRLEVNNVVVIHHGHSRPHLIKYQCAGWNGEVSIRNIHGDID